MPRVDHRVYVSHLSVCDAVHSVLRLGAYFKNIRRRTSFNPVHGVTAQFYHPSMHHLSSVYTASRHLIRRVHIGTHLQPCLWCALQQARQVRSGMHVEATCHSNQKHMRWSGIELPYNWHPRLSNGKVYIFRLDLHLFACFRPVTLQVEILHR